MLEGGSHQRYFLMLEGGSHHLYDVLAPECSVNDVISGRPELRHPDGGAFSLSEFLLPGHFIVMALLQEVEDVKLNSH